MAKTTRVVLTCDLHGDDTDAVTTLSISDGNARYELDVCEPHLEELTGPARRVRSRRRGTAAKSVRRSSGTATKKRSARTGRGRRAVDPAAVREWARANGYTVGDRGRIPAPVVEAFRAAG
jgi:Lsr2